MPRIENAAMESEIADSLVGEVEQEAPREAPVSEYAAHGDDLLNEQIMEDRDNVFRDGDAGYERLRSERPEAEPVEDRAHQGRQQPDAQQESQQTQQAVAPTPAQVAELIQGLDVKLKEIGYSEPMETLKFESELADLMGQKTSPGGAGLMDKNIGIVALSAGEFIGAGGFPADGDLSKIPPIPAAAAGAISRDVAVWLGRNPQTNPIHDEQMVGDTIYRGMANVIETWRQKGGTDPREINDAEMCIAFCESLHFGVTGKPKQFEAEQACNIVNHITSRIFGLSGKMEQWQERQAPRQSQGKRSGRGQRIPAQFRDGIKGSKAPRFKSNQDIFDGGAQDYQQQHGRL